MNNYDIICYETNIVSEEQKTFVETWHYSKSARSQMPKFIFELRLENILCGVAIFGQPCGVNCVQKYGEGLIELRRFCLRDEEPRNSESWFISRCLKVLKTKGIKKVLSYSDPNKGHLGTIYKASNFQYVGKSIGNNPQILRYNGKDIHMRQVYQKTKYGYVKSALHYQNLIRSGEAKLIPQEPKDVFLFKIS